MKDHEHAGEPRDETLAQAMEVARAFPNALSFGDQARAAAMVAPSGQAAFREVQLCSLTGWAQQRDAISALQRGGTDSAVGWNSDGVYRPEQLARVGDTPLVAVSGVRTLGEFAALPPAEFLARYLDVSTPRSSAGEGEPMERPRYLVLGGVVDGHDVVHVLYRCTSPGYHDPHHVDVLRIVQTDGVWSVDIATAGHEIVNSSWLMLSMQHDWFADGPNADDS